MDSPCSDLKKIVQREGPTATVVLAAPSATPDAGEQLDLRWRNARAHLERSGAADVELEQLDRAVEGLDHGEGAAFVLIANVGHPVWVEHLDDAVTRDLSVLDELPRLGAVIENRQRSIPHMVVLADRVGADVIAVDAGSELESAEIGGSELHIHRGHPGGWSQRRFQQRAENRWEANAGEVADVVVEMANRVEPRFIAVAGDVRAVTFLLDQLPPSVAAISQKLDGQSSELIADQTVRAAADVVARETVEALEAFKEAAGRGRAAVGAAETLTALSEGRAATLLVHDDPDDDRTAAFDRSGLTCWIDDATLRSTRPEGAVAGRLVDVAIRSALLSDAAIRMVPGHAGPDDGLGALLRW